MQQIHVPDFGIEHDSFGIELTPGAYELVDINASIKQKKIAEFDFKFNIIPDTISMKSVLTTSNPIHFNSELYKVLGFLNKDYQAGTPTSEKTSHDLECRQSSSELRLRRWFNC